MPGGDPLDFRVFGGPRSPNHRYLLQKLWSERSTSLKESPTGVLRDDSDSFVINALNFANLFPGGEPVGCKDLSPDGLEYRLRPKDLSPCTDDAFNDSDYYAAMPPCKDTISYDSDLDGRSDEFVKTTRVDESFETTSLKSCKTPARPNMSRFLSLEGRERFSLLPLDLIQTSLLPGTTAQTLNSILPPFGATDGKHDCKVYCSCHSKSGLAMPPRLPPKRPTNSSKRPGGLSLKLKNQRSPACARRFLICSFVGVILFLLVFWQAARMVMVPITVFLAVLSLALFLFILLCVCFIAFI